MSDRKFSFECLTHVKRGCKRYSRWTTYIERAKNPYNAYLQLIAKHPGVFPEAIHETDNKNYILRSFKLKDIIDHKEELMIEYDLNETIP